MVDPDSVPSIDCGNGTLDEVVAALIKLRAQYGNVQLYRRDWEWGTDRVDCITYTKDRGPDGSEFVGWEIE